MANKIWLQYNDAQHTKCMGAYTSPQEGEGYEFMLETTDEDQLYLQFLASMQPPVLLIMQQERDRLVQYATLKINPLQDAVDIDEATPDDIALLKKWKKYRSDLGKVDKQEHWPDAIDWPVPPVPLELTVSDESPA